ncbi:exported hypothetical protein [Mesorhizobium plurifarium]|uniref:Uncharacterized protein n=1 Tax=Mesorhizobium plurifarium TaxID=69974 RepID=A0A090FT82_MESPL|nr:exported hypothetical protein [Mesorhizobium plurifarium]
MTDCLALNKCLSFLVLFLYIQVVADEPLASVTNARRFGGIHSKERGALSWPNHYPVSFPVKAVSPATWKKSAASRCFSRRKSTCSRNATPSIKTLRPRTSSSPAICGSSPRSPWAIAATACRSAR